MNGADPRPNPRQRHDGWTSERQALFLATLEATGNVRSAAAAAGMNRASAYRLRDRPGGRRFGRAWDAALLRRRHRLLEAHFAKATLFPGRPARGDKGDGLCGRFFPRQDDEGDTGRETARQGQASQACRPLRRDPAALWALIDAVSESGVTQDLPSPNGVRAPRSAR